MADQLPVQVDFDPALHSPARLKIMMVLAVSPTATFNNIAKLANLTPGNLGTHLKALEAAGYVRPYHTLIDLKPRVRYQVTTEGRVALKQYCERVAAALTSLQDIVARQPAAEPASV